MNRMFATFVIALSTAGCALNQPGQGVTRNIAMSWGCNYEVVRHRAKESKARLTAGHHWIPQVGWDACDLLANIGAPRDVDKRQSTYGRSASWWYPKGEYDVRLVTLAQDGPRWVVDYVAW